jgi:hypothetical protein
LSIYLSFNLSVSLSVLLSFCHSLCFFVFLSSCFYVFLSFFLSFRVSRPPSRTFQACKKMLIKFWHFFFSFFWNSILEYCKYCVQRKKRDKQGSPKCWKQQLTVYTCV